MDDNKLISEECRRVPKARAELRKAGLKPNTAQAESGLTEAEVYALGYGLATVVPARAPRRGSFSERDLRQVAEVYASLKQAEGN